MKKCCKCQETKSLEDFHRRAAAKDGRQASCKKCNNDNARRWMKENPEKFEANWRKHSYGEEAALKRKASRYGLSVEQLKAMIDEADGQCSICKRPPVKTLVIDHCHTSLGVRGLLCERCNTGLGLFADNVEFLSAAIAYLQK